MEQKYFYELFRYRDVRHNELESIVQSTAKYGCRIVNFDLHPRGECYILAEFTKEDYIEFKRKESLNPYIHHFNYDQK